MDLRRTTSYANPLCMNAKPATSVSPDWDDLRLFLAVVRRGSFLQASRIVGMVPSSLSRRMDRLESGIGQMLLQRGAEGVRPTTRGRKLATVAEAMERAFAAQGDPAEGLGGTVTLSAGEGFTPILLDVIAAMRAELPGCDIELLTDQRLVKVAKGAADIAIRTVHLGEPSLIYRSVAQIRFGLYASPDYAAQLGPDPRVEAAELIDLVAPLGEMPVMRVARAMGFGSRRLRLSSFDALAGAVREGLGVGVLPRISADDLLPLFDHVELPPMDVYVVAHPDGLKEPQVRLAFDLCCDRLRRHLMVTRI